MRRKLCVQVLDGARLDGRRRAGMCSSMSGAAGTAVQQDGDMLRAPLPRRGAKRTTQLQATHALCLLLLRKGFSTPDMQSMQAPCLLPLVPAGTRARAGRPAARRWALRP